VQRPASRAALDVAGDPSETGKALLTDLREGKMTYPLLLAMERDRELAPLLEDLCASEDVALDAGVAAKVARSIAKAGVTEDCLAFAMRLCAEAMASLEVLPQGRARASLESVAMATPRRRR